MPARAGSKRIPDKNLQEINGVSLVGHAVRHALLSQTITHTVVSTDSDEIWANVLSTPLAREAADEKVETRDGSRPRPRRLNVLDRPAHLAGDDVVTADVELHALEWWEQTYGELPEIIVRVNPTQPLRFFVDIDACVFALAVPFPHMVEVAPTSALTVHEVPSPYRTARIDEFGRLLPFFERPLWNRPEQQWEPSYVWNGAAHAARVPEFVTHGDYYHPGRTAAVVIPPERGFDINTLEDLERARERMDLGAVAGTATPLRLEE